MEVLEFFQLSAGKWSALKSSHNLASGEQTANKATLQIEWLEPAAPDVSRLCEHQQIDPSLALGGWRLNWEDTTGLGKPQLGSAVLIAIAEPQTLNEGRLLQTIGTGAPTLGHYRFSDDKLSLMLESSTLAVEEHLWYESDNVRCRSSVVKGEQGVNVASFYSEVRLMTAPPKE
jgi:CpeS-like protein